VPTALGNDLFGAMAFDGTKFLAGSLNGTGSSMSSTDGVAWTQETPPPTGPFQFNNGLTYGAGKFVGTFQTTPSVQWSYTGTGIDATVLTTSDNSNFDLFTAGESVVENSGGQPVTSAITVSDEVVVGKWTQAAPIEVLNQKTEAMGVAYGDWKSVAYGNGRWVCSGLGNASSGRIIYSDDNGLTWQNGTISANTAEQYISAKKIAYGAGGWTGVIDQSSPSLSGKSLVGSTDGITWTIKETTGKITNASGGTVNNFNDGRDFGDLYWDGSQFIMTGRYIYTSPDGENWQELDTYNTPIGGNFPANSRGVAYGTAANGTNYYVFVGNNTAMSQPGTIYYSTDLITFTAANPTLTGGWSNQTIINGEPWVDVTYGNGMFVAVGNTNQANQENTAFKTLIYSTDAINWKVCNSLDNNFLTGQFYQVTYGNGIFTACGQEPNGGGNGNGYSLDGINWLPVVRGDYASSDSYAK
jgi:hypothetical protein